MSNIMTGNDFEDLGSNSSRGYSVSKPAPEPSESIFKRFKQVTSVSEVLRIFGACAVLASMSLFLLQGWADGNDIQRYLKLLGQTGLLTAAGIALSFVLKENKGARLFFGLSLISVVANFTILGALIYSMFQLDGGLIDYPDMMTWSAVNAVLFWPICVGAAALLAVLSRFSFGIFARKISATLTINFLLLNALLLVPVRSSLAISVLAIIALITAVRLANKFVSNKEVLLTRETKFALSTLFLPGVIIIGRALGLYNIDEILLITLSGLSYVALRTWVTHMEPSFSRRLMAITQYALGINVALQTVWLIPTAVYETVSPLAFSAIVLGFVFDQLRQSKDERWKSIMLNITIVALTIISASFAAFSDALLLKFSCLASAAMMFAFAVKMKPAVTDIGFSRLIGVLGVVATALLVGIELVAQAHLSTWMMVGLIGMLLIIGASLYERFALRLTGAARSPIEAEG